MPGTTERSATRSTLVGLAFGFSAALAYGTSQVLARHAVSHQAPPLIGSFLAIFWGTLGFSLLTMRNLGQRSVNFRRGALYCTLGGVFSAAAVTLSFQALSRGNVVVVSPVTATNPLFTLIFASVLLRGIERITPRIVLGALLVVSGVIVLTLG